MHIDQLDDWVLCRIYKKKSPGKSSEQKVEESYGQIPTTNNDTTEVQQAYKFPRPCSLSHLWEYEYMGSISQLMNDNSNYNVSFDQYQEPAINNGKQLGQIIQQQPYNTSPMMPQVNQTVFVNPTYELQWDRIYDRSDLFGKVQTYVVA